MPTKKNRSGAGTLKPDSGTATGQPNATSADGSSLAPVSPTPRGEMKTPNDLIQGTVEHSPGYGQSGF